MNNSETSNLPEWAGADLVYKRLGDAAAAIAQRDHAAWRQSKKARKADKFAVSETVTEIIEALNRGDEEECKALSLRHINEWSGHHER